MKKILLLLVLLSHAILAHASGIGMSGSGVGGMPSSPVFSGTVSSTKACAAGYTRYYGTNYCQKDVNLLVNTLSATTCVQTAALAGVTDARAVQMMAVLYMKTVGAVGNISTGMYWFMPTDTTCAGSNVGIFRHTNREYVATALGTIVGSMDAGPRIVKTNTTGQTYVKPINANSIEVYVLGYYD